MPSLKTIRKRITSVKATQKITRAMKMVAGARLNRAQQRITALRPYALKTREVLDGVSATMATKQIAPEDLAGDEGEQADRPEVPRRRRGGAPAAPAPARAHGAARRPVGRPRPLRRVQHQRRQ